MTPRWGATSGCTNARPRLLFVRWSPAGDAPDGHVETDWVAFGSSTAEAKRAAQALTLQEVKDHLDRAVRAREQEPDW
jgi:hypothetical protein